MGFGSWKIYNGTTWTLDEAVKVRCLKNDDEVNQAQEIEKHIKLVANRVRNVNSVLRGIRMLFLRQSFFFSCENT